MKRIAQVTADLGSPEAVREWMESITQGRVPRPGVDWGRLTGKIVAMSEIILAETPEAKEDGWARLQKIGKH